MAEQVCAAPIALISFVDQDRQWFKSRLGLETTESPRSAGLCAHAILGEGIFQADDLCGREHSGYRERCRPQFHFTPRRGWNNDPIGMVYQDGTWHMFFQYNPFGVTWGNMHWGHAVSRDLVHWQELPVAFYQRSLVDMAFSGGAVLDEGNTAGFQARDGGGKDAAGVITNNVEYYDLTGNWNTDTAMTGPRTLHTATLLTNHATGIQASSQLCLARECPRASAGRRAGGDGCRGGSHRSQPPAGPAAGVITPWIHGRPTGSRRWLRL